MTAHRCAGGLKKEVRPTVRLPCHSHFVGFFNVPVQSPTRGHPFYGYSLVSIMSVSNFVSEFLSSGGAGTVPSGSGYISFLGFPSSSHPAWGPAVIQNKHSAYCDGRLAINFSGILSSMALNTSSSDSLSFRHVSLCQWIMPLGFANAYRYLKVYTPKTEVITLLK